MKTIIKAGGGSTAGSLHRNSNRNNQDSFAFQQGDGYIVGVVADGCGSAYRSEFGAHLVAYRVAEALDTGMAQAFCNGPISYNCQEPWPRDLYNSIVNQAVKDPLGHQISCSDRCRLASHQVHRYTRGPCLLEWLRLS